MQNPPVLLRPKCMLSNRETILLRALLLVLVLEHPEPTEHEVSAATAAFEALSSKFTRDVKLFRGRTEPVPPRLVAVFFLPREDPPEEVDDEREERDRLFVFLGGIFFSKK